ncbi:MAG: glycerol-3-phosphate 1-O-acyltransferase PlsY [Proteobacteria bacterium]|nr:glycerol-3-phosphate 1-O-acyltransferase PlsY [Pseudomonadota bacterium]
MIGLLIKIALSYLLGSVSGSMVVGSLRQVDIRQQGSGNAGGTNAFRTQGFKFALFVVLIDIGKGFLAAWLLPQFDLGKLDADISLDVQMLSCGFAVVVGHCFPLWHGFRGGKGAATTVGALLFIHPLVVIPMITVWLSVLVLTGWVGLATILAAVTMVPAFLWMDGTSGPLWLGIALAVFLIFTHRSNITDMLNGTEYRFKKIMLRNWFS